jgi:hypothetical protein
MSETSTIVVSKKLKQELAGYKQFDRETYEDVIGRLIHIAEAKEEGDLSEETLKKIEIGRKDIREGRVYTTEQLRKKLGI